MNDIWGKTLHSHALAALKLILNLHGRIFYYKPIDLLWLIQDKIKNKTL